MKTPFYEKACVGFTVFTRVVAVVAIYFAMTYGY